MTTAAPRVDAVDPRVLATLAGLELRARYLMEGFLGGIHGSPFHGLSVEFRDYRPYLPGDDLRRVDWRLFARSDRLCVKRYEEETNARCYLVCDSSASMSYRGERAWGAKIECARVVALALGWLLLRQGDAAGLVTWSAEELRYLAPARAPYQVGSLLRVLEALAPARRALLADLLAHTARIAHRRSLVIVLSDLLDPAEAVVQGLERLRFLGHECVCLQILDPDELDLPFREGVVEDLETGERRQLDAGARAAYRERFDAFLDEWKKRLRQLEVPHAVLRTDEDPGRALARLLAERTRR